MLGGLIDPEASSFRLYCMSTSAGARSLIVLHRLKENDIVLTLQKKEKGLWKSLSAKAAPVRLLLSGAAVYDSLLIVSLRNHLAALLMKTL